MYLLFCSTCLNSWAQDTLLSHKIDISFQQSSLSQGIEVLGDIDGIAFSYAADIIDPQQMIKDAVFKQAALSTVLNHILQSTNLTYLCIDNQLILKKKKVALPFIIKGKVISVESNMPMEYAGIQVKGTSIFTYTNAQGFFELELQPAMREDTLQIAALNYYRKDIAISHFSDEKEQNITLSPRVMDTVIIRPRKYDSLTLGNDSKRDKGSIYIDTHGQQTLLFIENTNKLDGYIQTLGYYLSSKGNITAPFRVRLYAKGPDAKPGNDILDEIIIVVPNTKKEGWYFVDMSKYYINLPTDGFFMGIEGVFPNDYLLSADTPDNLENIQEISPDKLAYGQRLGYNHKKDNNTWHFSLAHTWFKLKRDNFNVMLKAEIKYVIDE